METKEIRTERAISVGGVTLIPVVESGSSGWRMGDVVCFSGYKHPVAIIAITGGQKKVFRISGEEIAIDELSKEFPSVKKAIESV